MSFLSFKENPFFFSQKNIIFKFNNCKFWFKCNVCYTWTRWSYIAESFSIKLGHKNHTEKKITHKYLGFSGYAPMLRFHWAPDNSVTNCQTWLPATSFPNSSQLPALRIAPACFMRGVETAWVLKSPSLAKPSYIWILMTLESYLLFL